MAVAPHSTPRGVRTWRPLLTELTVGDGTTGFKRVAVVHDGRELAAFELSRDQCEWIAALLLGRESASPEAA